MSAITFSEYLQREGSRDPIALEFAKKARLHKTFPNPKTWQELRHYLYVEGTTDLELFTARKIWRQYLES